MERNPQKGFLGNYPGITPTILVSPEDENGYRMIKVQFKGKFIEYGNNPNNPQPSTNYFDLDKNTFPDTCKYLCGLLELSKENSILHWGMTESHLNIDPI